MQKLLNDGRELSKRCNIRQIYMDLEDFDRIVLLDDYKDYRILIFGLKGVGKRAINGVEWKWTNETYQEEDSKTIKIFLDVRPGEQHYYHVSGISSLCFSTSRPKGTYERCLYCYDDYKIGVLHSCEGRKIFQCQICYQCFHDLEILNEHESLKVDGYYKCQYCGHEEFNGESCHTTHEADCYPNESWRCETCLKLIYTEEHVCEKDNFGYCNKCRYDYHSVQDREEHECMMVSDNRWWEPVGEKILQTHWFYDFETCRGEEEEVNGKKLYIHEVMAWCMRLMIPDDEVQREYESRGYVQELMDRVKSLRSKKTWYEEVDGTIRIYGKDLLSFISTCTYVCHKRGKDHPVLWAHNGSKFDAKFILDYYLKNGYDLAGEEYEFKISRGEEGWEKKTYQPKKSAVKKCFARINGSKLLTLDVGKIAFKCSCVHHPTALRELPKRFGLKISVAKGEFPYKRLKRSNWGLTLSHPTLDEYEIDSMSPKRRDEVKTWYDAQRVEPWDFDKQLWKYLFADVDVGAKCMEAYHQSSLGMHENIWLTCDPDLVGKHCSPLNYATSPAWALAMYQKWFLPEINILPPMATEFIRSSLRGGRTDKRCNWMKLDEDQVARGDKIVYYDFKSLYPSVQKCGIHDTHFPIGRGEWITFGGGFTVTKGPIGIGEWIENNDQLCELMKEKTGFLEIDFRVLKYVTHPTLHRVGTRFEDDPSNKLLFELDDQKNQTYAWPEIEEAIRCKEIEVTYIHQGFLFKRGTNVFDEYVDFFFEQKEKAEREENEGARALAKLLLNSLWGKLGQKAPANYEWVSDKRRLGVIWNNIENGTWELKSLVVKDDSRLRINYSKKDDKHNRHNTAPHLAAFVSMWGRVILHRKLLAEHGMRALYCDTDSSLVYLRGGVDEMKWVGNDIGDLTDEVPKMAPKTFKNPYITEVVFLAPKSYALKIKCSETGQEYHKVVCKGFEPSYDNSKVINFENMKELVCGKFKLDSFMNGKRARLSFHTLPKTSFKSSLCQEKISPTECEVSKTLTGLYTKGKVHPRDPRFISPFSNKFEAPASSFLEDISKHFE